MIKKLKMIKLMEKNLILGNVLRNRDNLFIISFPNSQYGILLELLSNYYKDFKQYSEINS